MLAAVRRITGCRNLVGCSGAGVLATEGEIEDEEGVAVLALAGDHTTVAPFLVGNLRGRDREAGREIGEIVSPYRRGESVLVLFPDTLNCNPDQLFRGLAESLAEVPLAGGGAADDGAGKKTYQMCGGQVTSNGVAGVLLTGELISTIGVTQSCRPLGLTMEVTGAEGNVITSLDGEPALDALRASVGEQFAADLDRLAGFLFLGVPLEEVPPGSTLERGSYAVRNIIGVNGETGTVAVGKKVARGDRVSFVLRDPISARDDLKAMLEEETAPDLHGENRLGLYFNCCARGSGLYGMPGIDTAFINRALGPLPLAGFFGFCEIASTRGAARLHNYSGVMTLISEQPQVSGEEPLQ
jgi:small ligand-binding sensory domain FIST